MQETTIGNIFTYSPSLYDKLHEFPNLIKLKFLIPNTIILIQRNNDVRLKALQQNYFNILKTICFYDYKERLDME